MAQLLCVADVARLVGLTPAAIRSAARSGRIRVEARTLSGVRLFDVAEVQRFIRERASRRAMVAPSGEAA
jgi:DNA-binding transcriptional MerR regulator